MASPRFAILGHALNRDRRLRLVPPLAQLAWLKLTAAMIQERLSVLRLGSRVLIGGEIAAFADIPETEWTPHVDALVEFGLLTIEEDGALGVPALAPRQAADVTDRRAAASRQNGCKGGRPRKTPDPSQREIMLSIAGGRAVASADAEPAVGETCQVSQVSPAIAELESDSLETKLAVSQADVQRVGHAAAAAAGLQGRGHFGAVRQWLTAGATEALIVGTIEATMDLGRRPEHLGYFTKAIQEAMSRPSQPGPSSEAFQAWQQAYEDWCRSGRVGPMPKAALFDNASSRVAA